MAEKQILLVGPQHAKSTGAYGGGTGGYTRNMQTYLSTLSGDGLELRPFYHSVRGQSKGIAGTLWYRLLRDSFGFAWSCLWRRPAAVHVLAQYRGAVVREFAQLLICRVLRIPFCYDVKAGAFAQSYLQGRRLYRMMVRRLVRSADVVFAEGRKTEDILNKDFSRAAVFFPNFVPETEIPETVPQRLTAPVIKLLFVGYCYADKGTRDLVEGAQIAAGQGVLLQLDLIGAEAPDFTAWMDQRPPVPGLTVHRHGRQDHAVVLEAMTKADVYVYPTSHPGEGHNNSVNEAMMSGLVIVTRPQGFLGDVLPNDCAIMLDAVSAAEIARALHVIDNDRPAARELARHARLRLQTSYSSTVARRIFTDAYQTLLDATGK